MRKCPNRVGKSASAIFRSWNDCVDAITGLFIIMAAGRMLEQRLVILLVKLAVAASLASILVRSSRFKRMLLREERTFTQRIQLALGFASIFGTGVATRVLTGIYQS